MMSRTVLITGATGSVSSALIAALATSELKVRALARDRSKASQLEQRGVEVVLGDLNDPDSLPPAFQGVNDLWLLTAMDPRAPENSMNAVWAARHAGVERVVRLSAIGAGHDAPTRNGRLHALSDHELRQSGLRWTILRPHAFMQNLLWQADHIANQGAFYLNMGQGRLGMIDARDVADLAAHILRSAPELHHGKTYTPSGPKTLTYDEAAQQLGQVLGRKIQYVATTDEDAHAGLVGSGISNWLAGMFVEYGRALGDGFGDYTTADFQNVVGHPPRSFDTFARDHAAAFAA